MDRNFFSVTRASRMTDEILNRTASFLSYSFPSNQITLRAVLPLLILFISHTRP